MVNTVAELVMGYGFAIALFAGLPAVVLLMVFLPGLMRTTGETIGASGSPTTVATSRKLPLPQPLPKPRTMANTA
jgi:hypothetical protein